MAELERDGLRVHYETVGRGFPLIMVAGAALDGSFWRRAGYAERLADEFLCGLVDPRGMGKSSRPPDPSGYSIRETAADILAITDHLQLSRFAFWGSSLGGWVGIVLAADQPQRVAALVINGATPSLDYPGVGRGMREMARTLRRVGDTAVVVRELCDAEGVPADHWTRTADHGDSAVVAALLEGWLDYAWGGRAVPRRAAPRRAAAAHRSDADDRRGTRKLPRRGARSRRRDAHRPRSDTRRRRPRRRSPRVEGSLSHAAPFLRR